MRALAVGSLILGITLTLPRANAEITCVFDLLDANDVGGPSPAGIVVVDLFINELPADMWTASGMRLNCFAGVTIRYGDADDPNTPGPDPTLINPGLEDRFVTVLSEPRGRNSNARFTSGGAAVAGGYCPPAGTPTLTPSELNVAWFHSPPHSDGHPILGYIARIALDVSATGLPNSAFAAFYMDDAPAGATPVLLSQCLNGMPGTVWASFDSPDLDGFNWGVYIIPEPGAGIAALLAGAALRKRG